MRHDFIESREEIEEILKEIPLGYLGMAMAGEPYVVPLNYAYIDGKILFHCALEGKKLDYMAANPRVCFSVARQPDAEVRQHGQGDACHSDADSVICYGRARIIDNLEERHQALNDFNRYFRRDAKEIPLRRVETCGMVEITVEEMTGRRECDREVTCWHHVFAT